MSKSDKFWDKKAEGYAKSPVSDEASYQRKLAETQKLLTDQMHILEFGCGTGTTAICHAPHVRRIDAIDISENMLEIARDKAKDAGVNNIRFARGTLADFGAESESMDAVLGLNVIHLVPNRNEVLAEVARVLKPGGVFVSSTGCLGNSYFRLIRFIFPLAKILGLMPDLIILKEEDLAKEIESHGFSIESQWSHGLQNIGVFIIARKNGPTHDAAQLV